MALQVATDHDDGGSTRHGGMSMDEKDRGNNRRGHVDRTILRSKENGAPRDPFWIGGIARGSGRDKW